MAKAVKIDLKCDECRHLRSRHDKDGRCRAQRSVPGGRVYPCDCLAFRVSFEDEEKTP